MEKTNVLTLIITLVVGVILTGALLGPVISDATKTTNTFDNTEFARSQMKELEDGDSWTRTNEVWYYEGDVVTSNKSGNYSIVFTDNTVVREIANVRGTDVTYASNGVSSLDVTEGDTTLEITYNGGNNTTAFNYGFGAVPNGDYIMQKTTGGAYVLEDTVMYVTGVTNVANNNNSEVICKISGSIKDGFTVTTIPVKNATISDLTIGEITVNAVAVDGYVDLYKISNIQFTINGTFNDAPVSYDATYSTFVLPKEVTAELSEHLTPGQISLMGAIPVMVIVALLMVAVGAIAYRRAD